MAHILVVEDEINIRELISDILSPEGHSIIGVGSGEDAITRAKKEPFDLVVLDLRLPGIDGIETMHRLQKLPEVSLPDVIIITAHATVEAAVEGIRAGAVDFLIKPFEPDALRDAVGRAMSETIAFDRAAKIEPKVLQHTIKFIGQSKELKKLLRSIQQVAGTDATVLITGETGTGKELVARALHLSSRRREGPFISINCATLPETLVENELFGHERGAFTDARTKQIGKVFHAENGTLFLDEVGDLALTAQAKLLRLIEEHEYIPLGGLQPLKANVRLIAATHRDLTHLVRGGSFREDLYWRLRVIPIHIPSLRERDYEDIIELGHHFMEEFSKKHGIPKRAFTPDLERAMVDHTWPGNVRELRNFIERFLLLGDDYLPSLYPRKNSKSESQGTQKKPCGTMRQQAQQMERSIIIEALKKTEGNKKKAAHALGMSYRTLFYKIKKYSTVTEIIVN